MKEKFCDLKEKIHNGERLNFQDGVRLMESFNLLEIGKLADFARRKKCGDKVYYSKILYLSPTNICVTLCKFCAFYRKPGDPEGYVIPVEEAVKLASNPDIAEIHIVGGHHPTIKLDYFESLIKGIRAARPDLWIKAFTVVELDHFSKVNKIPVEEVILKLKNAGLNSLPGGGAEIFSPRVRKIICPLKISGKKWIEIMEIAHNYGLFSNATMLYGHIETAEERVDHLLKIRELQDRTGKILCFIPLGCQPENHELKEAKGTTGFDDLKVHAISRLLLDNIPHIKALWTTMGIKTAQAALHFGANDLGGTFVNEQVMDEAGGKTRRGITTAILKQIVLDAGRVPVETNSGYGQSGINGNDKGGKADPAEN
ncbi:MAG: CofH family radical SAM protein [Firmicutes bacterium]|nr:CofH family radical SAM protein [Bacillota bacterium]